MKGFTITFYYRHLDTGKSEEKCWHLCQDGFLPEVPLLGEELLMNCSELGWKGELLVVVSRRWIINIDDAPSGVILVLDKKADELDKSDTEVTMPDMREA